MKGTLKTALTPDLCRDCFKHLELNLFAWKHVTFTVLKICFIIIQLMLQQNNKKGCHQIKRLKDLFSIVKKKIVKHYYLIAMKTYNLCKNLCTTPTVKRLRGWISSDKKNIYFFKSFLFIRAVTRKLCSSGPSLK